MLMADLREGPQFGYTADARPLWTERDWAAEQIRIVLRDAGCPQAPANGGFTVDSTHPCNTDPCAAGSCYLVSVCGDIDDPARPARALARAAAVLAGAGYRTEHRPCRETRLRVWPPTDQIPVVAVTRSASRHCRRCAQMMTAVEYAACTGYGWAGRCSRCQAEHLDHAAAEQSRAEDVAG
ncbi:hypothetical protein [Actinomadura violacea]|uniref:Uncharacterized protein n=1 Tax=Actinomadura violacea TaxID=2819934 RepID=A0ABS3RNG3_9ACTN|nr:hypothetical protein [Actinomadura violacea]MBO2458151.1 hypothetical protein [Actinomadura violacea]